MFSGDNDEKLVPNNGWVDVNGGMDWFVKIANTNSSALTGTNSQFAPYIGSAGTYHCPGDSIASQNGTRVRSYALNSSLNNSVLGTGAIAGRSYIRALKTTDLNTPGPANIFAFVCESAYTQLYSGNSVFSFDPGLASGSEYWRNLPAFYHGKASVLSFADGHSELHRWLEGSTYRPVSFGQTTSTHIIVGVSQDYEWMNDHTVYH